ncbi:MAG: hypothetical protein LBH44_10150 [Treponema sp.]|jgi:hypothetical protein|nr:hypothetical protein [Treponema sp.]
MDDADTGNLNGTWSNVYEDWITTIKINTSAKSIEYIGAYKGTIANSPDFSAANGVLIIQFTKYWEWDSLDENPDKAGKYGALYWRDLKPDSVYMADAYTGFAHTMFEKYSDAEAAFTPDNAGDYVDWSIVGIYTK